MEDKNVSIDSIQEDANVRADYGDMEELISSIKEHGILTPLIVNKDMVLVAGYRRLKAAKSLKMEEVPVRILEGEAQEDRDYEIKLVENIQRKALDPLEEADAFTDYIKKTGHSEEHLAKKLGKTTGYVQRRAILNNLDKSIRKAIKDNKIKMGHGLILARLEPKAQKEVLKVLTENSWVPGVDELGDYIDDKYKADLDNALFDKTKGPDGKGNGDTGCMNCPFNGSEQTLLVETEESIAGCCMNPTCFIKKTNDWVAEEIKILEEKGIKIMSLPEVEAIKGAEKLENWNKEYDTAIKNLPKKPDTYVIVFASDDYGSVEKQVWRIVPGKAPKQEKYEPEEETLNLNTHEKLRRKADEWKRSFLLTKNSQNVKPGISLKATLLYHFMNQHLMSEEMEDRVYDILQIENDMVDGFPELLFDTDEDVLDKALLFAACATFHETNTTVLERIAPKMGLNWENDFEMTDEFLEIHTVEQLRDLAKEFGMEVVHAKRKPEYVDAIKQAWKKGQVPKVLRRQE